MIISTSTPHERLKARAFPTWVWRHVRAAKLELTRIPLARCRRRARCALIFRRRSTLTSPRRHLVRQPLILRVTHSPFWHCLTTPILVIDLRLSL